MITMEQVREGLENGAIDGDGHSIVAPQYFVERGFDEGDMQGLEITHESGSGKHQIYQDGDQFSGTPVTELRGIWCLSFHYWIADQCGLTSDDYGSYGGRGSQAQAIRRALVRWCERCEEGDEQRWIGCSV